MVRADSHRPSVYDVEAVYLYDFSKFVRWPAGAANGPMKICVAGNSEYEHELRETLAGEQVGGRSLSIQHVEHSEDEIGCAILFVGTSEQDHLDSLLSAVAGKPTLTVSDATGFLDHGGMIQFLLVGDRVRFAINLKAASKCNLSFSSELLKVAAKITGTQPDGGGA